MFWKKNNPIISLPASGIVIEPDLRTKQKSNLYICLLRGLIIFLAGMGTIGSYMTSFSIPFHKVPVFCTILIISFLLSFFYYNRIVLNVGYILFFATYAPLLFVFSKYINSGYAAILNKTMDVIDGYYILPAKQQYVEEISNRSLTVTVFCCFVGIFFCLILNAIISGYMCILATFLASFPLIAVGFFFEQKPDSLWFGFVLLSWTMVYVLKKSRLYKNKKKQKSSYQFKKGIHTFSYRNEAKGLFQTCLFLAASVTILFGTLLFLYPKDTFHTPLKWNHYKEDYDEPVRNYMVVGFSAFLNRYDATGGISDGRLGGISSVRPNFKTDLIVQFTPYSSNTVYLPAFYANEYKPFENRWSLNLDSYQSTENPTFISEEANNLKHNAKTDPHIFSGKMKIQTVGANSSYAYHPYYTLFDETLTDKLGLQYFGDYYLRKVSNKSTTDFTYYQSSSPSTFLEENRSSEKTSELDIPHDIQETLQAICKKQGFGGTQEEITNQIQSYLIKDFTYTTKPGLTPKETDFATYFLTKQKKGYCVYFATAATLLLRTMGIPARYVEGYAISYDKVLDGDEVKGANYEDWFTGTAPLGKTCVVQVEVSDADAHAWTEYYQEGFGWVPLEVTASRSANDETTNAFWDFFSSAFRNDTNATDKTQTFTALNQGISKHSRKIGLYIVVMILLFVAGKLGIQKWNWFKKLHHKSLNMRVVGQYQYINKMLIHQHGAGINNQNHSFVKNWIEKHFPSQSINYEQWISLVKKGSYGNRELTADEYEFCQTVFSKLKTEIRRDLKLHKKASSYFLHAPK